MKQNCDLCKVSSTSSSPPLLKAGKTKVLIDAEHHEHHHVDDKSSSMKGAKYLSAKHYSAESPPLKPVTSAVATPSALAIASQAAGSVEQKHQKQSQQSAPPYHPHLHHHQFNGFEEYYSAPLLSPALMMDMMLAAHLLRG